MGWAPLSWEPGEREGDARKGKGHVSGLGGSLLLAFRGQLEGSRSRTELRNHPHLDERAAVQGGGLRGEEAIKGTPEPQAPTQCPVESWAWTS